jgi:hypothetical protein
VQAAFEELRLEAQEDKVEVLPVHSPKKAGDTLLSLVA